MQLLKEKKVKRLLLLLVIIVCLGAFRIYLPTLVMRPKDIHCDSMADVIKAERSVWIYKPLTDTLLIQDSVRNIRLVVKEACAYDARFFGKMYFQGFFPWAIIYNFDEFKLFGIWFDYADFGNNLSKIAGIALEVGDHSKDQVFGGTSYIDNEKYNLSYQGERIKLPLTDTLRLTVWGYPNLFVRRDEFRKMEEQKQYEIIDLADSLKNSRMILGEIVFVKGDSVIAPKKRKYEETRLFIKNITEL